MENIKQDCQDRYTLSACTCSGRRDQETASARQLVKLVRKDRFSHLEKPCFSGFDFEALWITSTKLLRKNTEAKLTMYKPRNLKPRLFNPKSTKFSLMRRHTVHTQNRHGKRRSKTSPVRCKPWYGKVLILRVRPDLRVWYKEVKSTTVYNYRGQRFG